MGLLFDRESDNPCYGCSLYHAKCLLGSQGLQSYGYVHAHIYVQRHRFRKPQGIHCQAHHGGHHMVYFPLHFKDDIVISPNAL